MKNRAIHTLIAWLVIFASPAVMLYPLWSNPVCAGEDDLLWFYPTAKMVGQSLRDGRWDFPSFSSFSNTPETGSIALMADPQAAVMYPATWLFGVMETKSAYSLSIYIAFCLAGAGAYMYLRRIGLVQPAALFGALAFTFGGFMVAHRVHLCMIHTAAFLPWGLWCAESLSIRARPRQAFVGIVAVVACAVAAGHWPMFVYIAVIWSVYLLLRAKPLGQSLAVAAGACVIALIIVSPQIFATFGAAGDATRRNIGYATAGENSFFPAAAILWLFPMLMGSRTPNFFAQTWWGPWHLCEMLGYVGLATLVLAGGAVRRLYRPKELDAACNNNLNKIVRVWTWIAIGAFVWMLGYYLPSYRLIHALPVLGIVRCPARMVLALQIALATLAAISIHTIIDAKSSAVVQLAKTLRRGVVIYLPAIMLAALVLLASSACVLIYFCPRKPGGFEFFAGWANEALTAIKTTNPAVWIPAATMLTTALAISLWLARPKALSFILIVVLLGDLFFISRFVDIPAADAHVQNPASSPAATWLKQNTSYKKNHYRIWGLAESYDDRPSELLLPRTAGAMGFDTLADYGPLLSVQNAHLFGFNTLGITHDWERLIRENRLLSLHNVRYLLAASRKYRDVIESVKITAKPPNANRKNLLDDSRWEISNAEYRGGIMRLRTPVMWRWSTLRQPVNLADGKIYRMSLDARGPANGAGNFLQAELFLQFPDGRYLTSERLALKINAERICEQWRHFEYTFRAPINLGSRAFFRIFTMSERPIEVRNIQLTPSRLPAPSPADTTLPAGEQVYRKLAELKPVNPSDPPVVIYENRLCNELSPTHPRTSTNGKNLQNSRSNTP